LQHVALAYRYQNSYEPLLVDEADPYLGYTDEWTTDQEVTMESSLSSIITKGDIHVCDVRIARNAIPGCTVGVSTGCQHPGWFLVGVFMAKGFFTSDAWSVFMNPDDYSEVAVEAFTVRTVSWQDCMTVKRGDPVAEERNRIYLEGKDLFDQEAKNQNNSSSFYN